MRTNCMTAIIGNVLQVRHWPTSQFHGVIRHMHKSTKLIRIGVLLYPGCLKSGAMVPLDVFKVANTVAQLRPAAQRIVFDGIWVSTRRARTAIVDGVQFPTQAFDVAVIDALMVPGIDHCTPSDLAGLLEPLAPEVRALQAFAATGGVITASCSSACLLAHAGLLDGRRATTSWWLGAYFRKRFPNVVLDAEQLIVQDRNIVSSGGVTSYLDLALWLVGHFGGDELRQAVAKILVMDAARTSQSPYIASALIQGDGHAVIERARRWLNQHLGQPWTMSALAAYCNTSPRTLLRRFQDALGMSPVRYTQQLRVERAKALLESTQLSLEDITQRCGYADVSTFSKVFKQWAQLTPRDYRLRFGLRR
jgi:transcriptional regulator GlxA family with amidase domain